MRVLVSGATGFVGGRLVERLERPVVVTRDPERARGRLPDGAEVYAWQPLDEPLPAAALEGVDAVIHLAGEPLIEGRWTQRKKERIRDSRILGTRHLVEGILRAERRPRALVSTSAIGYYGDRGGEQLTEQSAPGSDFLADVCQAWEAEAKRASEAGVRVVQARLGVVLGQGGGALSQMLTPFRLGVGGRLGSGEQYMSWVHLDDAARLLEFCAENEAASGPVNVVSPDPVTNLEFTKTLGSVLRRPTIFPVPVFALRLAFGEKADVLLASQRVLPARAGELGFSFEHRELDGALRDVLDGGRRGG